MRHTIQRLALILALALLVLPASGQSRPAPLDRILLQEGTWAKVLPEGSPQIEPLSFGTVSMDYIPDGGPGFWIHQATGPQSNPFAKVGDTVTLYHAGSGETLQRTIAARRRFHSDGNTFDKGIIGGGWAYLTTNTDPQIRPTPPDDETPFGVMEEPNPDVPPSAEPAPYSIDSYGWLVLPGKPDVQPLVGAAPSIQERLLNGILKEVARATPEIVGEFGRIPYHATQKPWTAAEIQQQIASYIEMYREHASDRFKAIRGPEGRTLYVGGIEPFDPEDGETQPYMLTLILDERGTIVARERGSRNIVGRGDLDGDAVDEIIFSTGIARWDGTRWHFPEPEPYSWH